jgi:hypothetical protein
VAFCLFYLVFVEAAHAPVAVHCNVWGCAQRSLCM